MDNHERLSITSAAFPWIGAMNGGLDLKQVREIMMRYLEPLPIPIEIYDFDASAIVKPRSHSEIKENNHD